MELIPDERLLELLYHPGRATRPEVTRLAAEIIRSRATVRRLLDSLGGGAPPKSGPA